MGRMAWARSDGQPVSPRVRPISRSPSPRLRSRAISSGALPTRVSGARCARCATTNSPPAPPGIDVFRTKVTAFALGSLLGGLGGGLFAGGFSYISPDQFAFSDSIVLLTMALLGGVSSPIGSTIGTGLLILIPEWLRFLKSVPGPLSRDLRRRGHPHRRLHARGHLGLRRQVVPNPQAAPPPKSAEPLTLRPANSGAPVALEVRGLAKNFGGLKAVDGVDFRVRRGGVHALIGPNGSGKTTTLNVVTGLYRATAGEILVDGVDVTALPAHKRTIAGLARTFQNIRLFRSMTALENVVIGAERDGNALVEGGHDALRAAPAPRSTSSG